MDWESHYFKVRNWFLGAICTFAIVAILTTYYLNDVPLTHPYRIVQGLILTVAITGFFTQNRRAHIWISSVYLGILLTCQILFRLTPGLSS